MDSRNNNIRAIVSIDMNGLKELNDSKGHEAGDAALAAIGKAIKRCVSNDCKGYRVGGDEFIVIFNKADEDLVIRTCDRIRNEVAGSAAEDSIAGILQVSLSE